MFNTESKKVTSYFTDRVDYDSMKINHDLKMGIEGLYEDGVPVLLENDRFTIYNKFKVTACPTSHHLPSAYF